MAESDDMREEMRNAITVALTLASVAQRGVVHARERARDDAQARVQATQAEAEAVAALERARQTIDPDQAQAQTESAPADAHRFAELNGPTWWDNANAEQIAGKWSEVQQAVDSQDPDVAAAARQASATMSDELRERYDVDPSQIDATVDQQLGAYQQQPPAGADQSSGLLAGGTQGLDEAATMSPQQRRAELRDSDAPEDAIESALVVEDAFPHRTNEVHHAEGAHQAGAERSASQAPRRTPARRPG